MKVEKIIQNPLEIIFVQSKRKLYDSSMKSYISFLIKQSQYISISCYFSLHNLVLSIRFICTKSNLFGNVTTIAHQLIIFRGPTKSLCQNIENSNLIMLCLKLSFSTFWMETLSFVKQMSIQDHSYIFITSNFLTLYHILCYILQ